jgi:hypothetical protein
MPPSASFGTFHRYRATEPGRSPPSTDRVTRVSARSGKQGPTLVVLRLLASARSAARVPAANWASFPVHEAFFRYLTRVVLAAASLLTEASGGGGSCYQVA